ncbi:MAG: preprotein translocase subunit SecE [Burkholderiaceae bacterium]|nr:preprotein translocase subunit SecE [Burkholderiaceae bacterium]
MANQNVDTVTSLADRAKFVVALAVVVAGLVGFYMLEGQPAIARVGSVLAGLLVGAAIAAFSEPGRRFFGFARDSWNETRRVVWPSRKETIQMTMTVFVFVIIMAIFLWLVDKTLQIALYDWFLGWRN